MKSNRFVPCFFIIYSIISSTSGYSTGLNDISSTDIVLPPQTPEVGQTFIIGGENAKDGQAPYMCSLQKDGIHICGCAILSSKFVSTAAHCVVRKSPEQLRILVGTNNLNEFGDYYNANQVITHEKYFLSVFRYDIAVVKVDGPILFNDKVQSIRFSTKAATHGSLALLTGWGRTNNGSYPDQLQVINLPVVSTVECRKILGKIVHDSHICTFARAGQGACYADSGSPLVLDNELIGIVNFGRPCAKGYPDVYAKVSYVADWIKSKTGL